MAAPRLVAVALLAAALFGWPFVLAPDGTVLGVPAVWAWLLVTWASVIALVALALREP